MAVAVPENQEIEAILDTNFNAAFADTAESLKPRLHEWIDEPLEVIRFIPDESTYFKWRAEHRLSIHELDNHEWSKGDDFIVDFGGHRVGYLSFHLSAIGTNIDAPCRLRLVFGEVPTDVAEDLHPCSTWISTSWLPDETINVDWLPTDVSLPRRYSFRYVRIQVIDNGPKFRVTFSRLRATGVSAVDPATPVPALPLFDPQLRAIDAIAMRTLRDCMQTVFEDGPRRDRRLWLGDLRLQALANYATFADFSLAKRCLYLFAALPRTDASLPACLFEFPALRGASDYIVDYDALFGVALCEYVQASGDLETGRALWDTALGSMRGPLAHIDPETHRFVGARTSAWKFCDWAENLHTDASMHGVVLLVCTKMNALSALVFPDAPLPFADEVASMKDGAAGFLRSATVEGEEPLFVSGPGEQVSWSSAAWLSLSGAFPAPVAKRALLATLAHPRAVKPLTPYCFHHVAEALAVVGAERECLQLIRDYWGGMVAAGADTFWECFDPNDSRRSPYGDCHNNSYCHAWSCTPSYLLRVVLKEWFEKKGNSEEAGVVSRIM
ncbi:bacterial alpha-L-rhamnosidase domain-containing protein [Mycena crocata]|nr:bacterial alpha-L-rhamnosidase domain-containing protein [Mycena crocata]